MKYNDQMTEKTKKTIKIISFILVLVFLGIITLIIGKPMIKFVSEPEKFRLWVEDKGFLGKIAFVLMVFFQVVFALIPGEPLEIGGGYAFGAVQGTLLTVIGTVLGSITVFLLVKKWGIKLCEVFFERDKLLSLKILKNKRRRNILAFLIFFLPGTPKDLITYFLGLTDIKFSTVLFLSGIARLPSIISSTLGGDALGVKQYTMAILVFAITLVISGTGFLIYEKIIIKHKK